MSNGERTNKNEVFGLISDAEITCDEFNVGPKDCLLVQPMERASQVKWKNVFGHDHVDKKSRPQIHLEKNYRTTK